MATERLMTLLRRIGLVGVSRDLKALADEGTGQRGGSQARRFTFLNGLSLLVTLTLPALGIAIWLEGCGARNAQGPGDGDMERAHRDQPRNLNASFHQNLRTAKVDNPLLRPMNDGVRYDPAGARVTLSGEDATARGGLATNVAVQGDFEVTVSYEIVRADKPPKGYGSGVSVYAALDPTTNDAVSLARRLMPNGRTIFVSNRMVPVDDRLTHKVKEIPSRQAAGKLRLVRIGSRVRCLAAEGGNPAFDLVDEVDFGPGEVRIVQCGGNTGGAKCALDVRLLDFSIRAVRFSGEAQPERPKHWLLAAALVVLGIITLALVVWISRRVKRRSFG